MNKKDNKIAVLSGVAILAGLLLFRKNLFNGDEEGSGSLGGTDERNDKNFPGEQGEYFLSFPDENPEEYPYYFVNDTPIQDDAVLNDENPLNEFLKGIGLLGTGVGLNILGYRTAKNIASAIDRKYIPDDLPENKLKRFLQDPYQISQASKESIDKKIAKEAAKDAAGEMAERQSAKGIIDVTTKKSIREASTTIKTLRKVTNFIPFGIDVPIGAAIDVYATRNEKNPISWQDAFNAAGAGEAAQLVVTGAGAAIGSAVPVAGTAAGSVAGQFLGISADIAATEAYYYSQGYDDTIVSLLIGEKEVKVMEINSQAQTLESSTGKIRVLTLDNSLTYSSQSRNKANTFLASQQAVYAPKAEKQQNFVENILSRNQSRQSGAAFLAGQQSRFAPKAEKQQNIIEKIFTNLRQGREKAREEARKQAEAQRTAELKRIERSNTAKYFSGGRVYGDPYIRDSQGRAIGSKAPVGYTKKNEPVFR